LFASNDIFPRLAAIKELKLTRVKKMDSSLWLPIVLTIGALITGIGSWIQYANEQKNKTEAKQTEMRADSLAKENIRLLEEVAKGSEKSSQQLADVTGKLLEAQATIEILRKEGFDNALGSDDTYLVVGGASNNQILMHNPSPLPLFDVGLQIWNYAELQKCDIRQVNGEYIIERNCYDNSRHSEMHPVVYGDAYFATKLECQSDRPLKYRGFFVCRKSKYYTDLLYIPSKGSIARRFKWINDKMSEIKIYNPQNIEINWNKEFPYPPTFKFL
jgi:hypothetical protein